MTPGRLAATVALLLHVGGCAGSLGRTGEPTRSWRDDRGPRCKRDLILVKDLPSPSKNASERLSPNTSTSEPFPASALEQAERFSVAVRAVRGVPPDETQAQVTASDPITVPATPVLVEGTGIVIDRTGLILTNHHVVRRATDVEVWTPQTDWVPARVIGADPLNDLAVIGIEDPLTEAARLADVGSHRADARLAALGFLPGCERADGPTALTGLLTGAHRSLQSALDPTLTRYYGDLLETTIPLQPGHSGGALIDASGAVVGLNTAAVVQRSTGRRVGYAIPMTAHIRGIISRLALGAPVVHGYLGVLVCTCDAHAGAVVIEDVFPDSPAAQADLRLGDTIISVANTPIQSAAHLAELVRANPPHQDLSVRVWRNDHARDLIVQPSSRP